ncbi:hypothetical protein BS50DRAFT_567518 [Corynespora cassiicola Philippines]|uniref:Mitochondrial ribosomal protein-like protein n=1 Tax=Corynespora cassiicola Philippines TaxID=1448308 RepID=A0A2T2PAM8_CORCC|nr:hypothetical protein BS50DRAFT_567518 [Corynespora cassiicola Philippines]
MSTTLASTRAAAPAAILKSAVSKSTPAVRSPLWNRAQKKQVRDPKDLINETHRQLFPDLYRSDGTPKVKIQPADVMPKRPRKTEQPYVPRQPEQPKIQVYKAKQPIKRTCPDPVSAVTATQIAKLDPSGARTRLFSKDNPECARVGDILLVRQRTGDPFAGVCINIRRRGVDTAILLRGQLTRVGVEMWYKVYSPLVEGIEVVQRAAKRARRARLTYMRKEKHDRGDVSNVVRMYLRQKAALGTAEGKKKGLGGAAVGGKKGKRSGKRR